MQLCFQLQQDLQKGRGKSKRDEIKCTNTNYEKMDHTKDQCYAKGGGKEKEAPEWFKKMTERKAASASMNVAEKTENNDSKNYAMLTYSILLPSLSLLISKLKPKPLPPPTQVESSLIVAPAGTSPQIAQNS
jgi:hypothetical protein